MIVGDYEITGVAGSLRAVHIPTGQVCPVRVEDGKIIVTRCSADPDCDLTTDIEPTRL